MKNEFDFRLIHEFENAQCPSKPILNLLGSHDVSDTSRDSDGTVRTVMYFDDLCSMKIRESDAAFAFTFTTVIIS